MIRGLIVLGVLAGAGFGAYRMFDVGARSAGHLDSVPTCAVKPMQFEVRLSSLGALEAASSKQITAKFSGKILKVLPEGTLVNEGDEVVWMETTPYEDKLKEDLANLDLAKNDLSQAQEDDHLLLAQQQLDEASLQAKVAFQGRKLADANKQYENTAKMVEASLAPPSDLENRKLDQLQAELSLEESKIALEKFEKSKNSQIQISKSKIDKAKVMVDKYQQAVDDGKKDIADAVLKAPGQGHISYIPLRMGGTLMKVSEGTDVYQRTALIQIPDSTTMLASVPINELDITKVEVGQKAEVRVEAFPNKRYAAEVSKKSIVPTTDNSMRRFLFGGSDSSVREFQVTVKLLDEDANLRQGMTANVGIIVQEATERLAVPQDAVFREGDKNIVYKKQGEGFTVADVQLGLTNDNYVELTQGVQPGDVLLLRDPTKQLQKVGEEERLAGL
ncbi:MAG: HlyD family efflux transporter periplasmic adaptor subunit [Candidatus Sumerlaeota bacterium]|nr:HlyD family efflux transporter periplasmic adaptor subunit [Candidatus Sumerlaeota bacterium]